MGLIGMAARTAVVAGTATAVGNRVSRRQTNRWQKKADAQAYEQQQYVPPQPYTPPPPQYAPPPVYTPPPPMYAPPPVQYAPVPAPAAAAPADVMGELQRLGDMKAQGLLTDAEFAAAKAKILGM
jgi:hypothetical protein